MKKAQKTVFAQFDSKARTKNVRRHISLTFAYKALAVGVSYLLVPLTINYLNIEQYGIWMTLLSVMSWIIFFDIGIGNGLRNKLSEAVAVNDNVLAKTYIATSYFAVTIIASTLFLILLFIIPIANWRAVFNTTIVSNKELSWVLFFVGSFFLTNFVLSLCNQMLYAYQKASLATMSQLLLNTFALFTIYILTQYTSGSLIYLGICYGFSMVLSNILLTYYFFAKHSSVIPSLKNIEFIKIKEIASLGLKFFSIQIAALIIFATDNMIITQILGPEHVTPYNIVFKLFSLILIVHGIICAPLWSAYTDAYAKGDFKWINSVLKHLNTLMAPIIFCVLILIFFARDIVNIWVGPEINFPNLLILYMGIYIIIAIWNNIYANFANGIGKIKPQLYTAILGGVINIPISIYFAKYLGMGTAGVILGSIVSLAPFAFVGPMHCFYLMKIIQNNE